MTETLIGKAKGRTIDLKKLWKASQHTSRKEGTFYF